MLILLTLLIIGASVPHVAKSEPSPGSGDRDQELFKLQAKIEEMGKKVTNLENLIRRLTDYQHLSRYKLPNQLDLCGQPVPLNHWELRERLEREFFLMLGDEGQTLLWLKRSRRYFPLIEKKLKEQGLPDDLKYVTIVESGLRATAYSSAGASGYWQFISSTGQRYGMDSNDWLDERRDIEKATDGAIKYLRDLYNLFRDWPLALAAYNAGEGRILKEMKAQRVSSYYELVLPQETERYVFRVVIAKLILSHPEKYGYHLDPEDYYQPIEFDTVFVGVPEGRLDLGVIADASGSYYREIKLLNPELKETSLPRGNYMIRIPKGAKRRFEENFRAGQGTFVLSSEKSVQDLKKKSERIEYTVKKGDTLFTIAQRFSVYVESLIEWNNLQKGKYIRPGEVLVILQP
ncbi:MAG: transglycosylase SLT domain-containing protein [Candidatus Tectomicrobia bacterium]|nr:transglycosylase SLT domain-containing protein [Candidatus Tectomicrobia bacterium]